MDVENPVSNVETVENSMLIVDKIVESRKSPMLIVDKIVENSTTKIRTLYEQIVNKRPRKRCFVDKC